MRTEFRQQVRQILQRPDWHIALGVATGLLLFISSGYHFALSGLLQSATTLREQAQQQRQMIEVQQRTLLRQPSRAALQAELLKIVQVDMAMLPLPQRILAPLNAAGGRLLHWIPASPEASPQNALRQRGTFTLQMRYAELLQFLQALLDHTLTPAVIEHLRMTQSATSKPQGASPLLDVTLLLADYRGQIEKAAQKRAATIFSTASGRDPFSRQQRTACQQENRWQDLAQLKGILGNSNNYTGWLMLSAGTWFKAVSGQTLADGKWRIDAVTNKQVLISLDDPQCGLQRHTFTLAES